MNEQGSRIRGVVVCHGTLADGFVEAVRQITGIGEEAFVALSNRGLSPESMTAALRGAVGDGPAVIFTDLTAGRCGFAARRLCRQFDNVAVVSGVSRQRRLHCVMHREDTLEELGPRLLAKGRSAVCCAPA